MRKRGRKDWNGEPSLSGLEVKSDIGVARKLEDVHQSLTLLVEKGEAIGLPTSAGNAQRINSLVEDIHEVLMDYQVCLLSHQSLPCLMLC